VTNNTSAALQYRSSINQRLGALPTLPTVVVQLLDLSPDDARYLDEVRRLAATDPTFAARVIEYANRASHYHSGGTAILNLTHAIAWLGVRQISSLVISMALLDAFPPQSDADRALWQHSVQVAVIARELARVTPGQQLDPDHLYLAGLLHDIGRFVIFLALPEGLARIDEHRWQTPRELILAEMATCATNHAAVGAEACAKWQLPEDITAVVRHHHDYHLPTDAAGDIWVHKKIRLIQIADYFSMWLMARGDDDVAQGSNGTGDDDEALENFRQLLSTLADSLDALNLAQLYHHAMRIRTTVVKETNAMLAGLGVL
jgi:putative nucleotidyltransferase with HDIG domain